MLFVFSVAIKLFSSQYSPCDGLIPHSRSHTACTNKTSPGDEIWLRHQEDKVEAQFICQKEDSDFTQNVSFTPACDGQSKDARYNKFTVRPLALKVQLFIPHAFSCRSCPLLHASNVVRVSARTQDFTWLMTVSPGDRYEHFVAWRDSRKDISVQRNPMSEDAQLCMKIPKLL